MEEVRFNNGEIAVNVSVCFEYYIGSVPTVVSDRGYHIFPCRISHNANELNHSYVNEQWDEYLKDNRKKVINGLYKNVTEDDPEIPYSKYHIGKIISYNVTSI